MNLQEALDYRSGCFIHQQPMQLYVRPEIRTYDIMYQRTEEGLSLWRKGNKPLRGANINFDGTFAINKNQPNLIRFLRSPLRMGMMCPQCRTIPFIDGCMEKGSLSLLNIKSPVHFYTFYLTLPEEGLAGSYQCQPGIEMILHHSGDKLYHLTGTIGGGSSEFHMGSYSKKMKVGRIMDSLFMLQTAQFDPSRIHSLAQMVQKIQIYNLFS
jgi:hypothetical protein